MRNQQYELVNEYLDWYESLLTQKQQEVMNMYFREDYSLQEIAENLNVSRSAVADLIKRVEATLLHYEEKLKLVEKFHARSKLYEELKKSEDDKVLNITSKLMDME